MSDESDRELRERLALLPPADQAFVALDLVEARRPMVELGGRRMVVPSRETTYALLPPEETARRIAAVSRTE